MSEPAAPPERKFLGMTTGTFTAALLGAFLGLAVGILGTMFTAWYTAKDPHLTKSYSPIITFAGEKNELGIVNVEIKSDGSFMVEDLEAEIRVLGAKVEDVKIVPEIIHAEYKVAGDAITLKAKILNRNESIQVAALARKEAGLPEIPRVEARGKGVVAEMVAPANRRHWLVEIIVFTCSILTAITSIFGMVLVFTSLYIQKMKISLKDLQEEIDRTRAERMAKTILDRE